jgi:hypothetical protein
MIDRAARRRARGQALTEFAIVLPLLMILFLGIIDLGRAIYIYNGVSQAAREIARAASVNPGNPLGSHPEVQKVVAIQKSLVGGIGDPIFHCEDNTGNTIPGDGSGGCAPGDVVRVEVFFMYNPVGLFGFPGTVRIASSSSNVIQ